MPTHDALDKILDALDAEDDYVRSWKLARQIRAALPARDAVVAAQAKAEALREAADAIQALHPGEVKASVIFLRECAREHDPRAAVSSVPQATEPTTGGDGS